jgi:hypothetical protein
MNKKRQFYFDKNRLKKILLISVIIGISLMFITAAIGLILYHLSYTNDKYFEITLGFPEWFEMHRDEFSPITVKVTSFGNLLINLILYVILCFVSIFVLTSLFKIEISKKKDLFRRA